MTGIASTTANLALWRLQWETLFSLPHLLDEVEMDDVDGCRLSEVENFGDNPGNLRMFRYVPENLPPHAPLVVVLHGCTQTAAGYDRSSGWSWLAEEHGFAVLFAQQRSENNPRRCFNWFRPGDIARDSGEAASIRHMVAAMAETYDLDRQRVFVTGLSAGGGMSNVLLAAYPDVFAAGAIIAGLPYRSAKTVHEAFQVMLEGVVRPREAWGDEVRGASPLGELAQSRIATSWPRVAVWQGLADDVVKPVNAGEIVKQWTDVHGLDEQASEEDVDGDIKRMRWRNAEGEVAVEAIAIAHLGHAVPIDAARPELHEKPGQHFADIGLSSTVEIARFFGLMPDDAPPRALIDVPPEDGELEPDTADAALAAVGLAPQTVAALAPSSSRGRRSRVRARDGLGRHRTGFPGGAAFADGAALADGVVLADEDEGREQPAPVADSTASAPPSPFAEAARASTAADTAPAMAPQPAEPAASVESAPPAAAPDDQSARARERRPLAARVLSRIAHLVGLSRLK